MPEHPLLFLSLKSGDEKVNGGKRRRDKGEYQGDRKEPIR